MDSAQILGTCLTRSGYKARKPQKKRSALRRPSLRGYFEGVKCSSTFLAVAALMTHEVPFASAGRA